MDITGPCQEYVSGQSTSDAPKVLSQAIHGGDIDLLKLVEGLGIYLTSTNVDNRCSGMKLLATVLSQLNAVSHKLPLEDVEYLVVFHCDRLKDRAIILPHVLAGLHSMVLQYQLSTEHVVLVCRTIFKEVHNQSLSFVDRHVVYSIMEHFLVYHITAIQAIGSEFVLGYIQAIDGERDPRNLLTVFNSVPIIVQKLPFETLAEDLFEVTSCYFPIDFTPPPNDPNAVSRESLITALRKCLTATPKYAEFCVPLLLDKLSSDVLSAKLDSLLTLECGAPVFGASNIQPFLDSIWAAIRKEMFMSSSAEVQVVSAKVLASVTSTLSPPSHVTGHTEDLIKSFIDKILQDCRRYLKEPGSRLMRPAVHALCAAARGSTSACSYMVLMVVPLLLDQYTKLSQEGQRKTLLEAVHSFVSVVKDTCAEVGASPLSEFKGQLLDTLLSDQAQTSPVTIATIRDLIEIPKLLEDSQVISCCIYLKSLALNCQDDSVRDNSCSCLGVVAKCYPAIAHEHLVSPILQIISNPSQTNSSTLRTIHILTSVATHPDLLTHILPSFVDYLSSILHSPSPDWDLAQCIATSIVSIYNYCVDGAGFNVCKGLLDGNGGLLVKLVCMCVKTSVQSEGYGKVLDSVAELIRRYSMTVSNEAVEWLYDFLMKLLVCGEPVSCAEGVVLSRLDYNQPPEQTQLISLISALVNAARKEVVAHHANALVPLLLKLGCYCPHMTTCQQAARAYASIANKAEGVASFLEGDTSTFLELLRNNCEMDLRIRALNLWTWVTKALVVKSDARGKEMALKLLDLCGDPCEEIRREAAQSFKHLLENSPDLLSTQCHANVRLFYKQQLFMHVVPQLVDQFKVAEPDKQQYLLRSLSHFMQGVPKQVLLSELPKLLPLLLESLSSSEAGLKVSTLNGFLSLIQDTPLSVVEHVPTLIPRLLTLAQDKASMAIRQAALKCIGALTVLPTHSVYPYQGTVLRCLAPCLDDHKRLVRQDAVGARSKWFLLGT